MAGEIFISYRRADMAWAKLLHDHLKAEGVEAWYDAQIGAGLDWRVATANALEASRIFVLLFSPMRPCPATSPRSWRPPPWRTS